MDTTKAVLLAIRLALAPAATIEPMPYDTFKTGLSFAGVSQMMLVDSDDATTWRNRRRSGVLGFWRQLKVGLYQQYIGQIETHNARVEGIAAAEEALTELAAELDCARADVDGEMDECDPDYVIGMQADGWYLPASSDRAPLPGETDCAYEWRMAAARSEGLNPAEFVNVDCGGLYR